MPRKSRADVLTERYGGKWTFRPRPHVDWVSDDGRRVRRHVDCRCWAIPNHRGSCQCPVSYILCDSDGERAIDISDPRCYAKDGTWTRTRAEK